MDKEFNIMYLILISILLFLLINNPIIKLTLALLYIVISIINGQKVKILPNVLLFISIVIISFLTPYGKILLQWGPIVITKEAILSGTGKASLLIGMIYISRTLTLENIRLKGSLGGVIEDTFLYFNQLTKGNRITIKNFMKEIDGRLLGLQKGKIDSQSEKIRTKSKSGYVILTITILLFALDNIRLLP